MTLQVQPVRPLGAKMSLQVELVRPLAKMLWQVQLVRLLGEGLMDQSVSLVVSHHHNIPAGLVQHTGCDCCSSGSEGLL